VIGEVVVLVGIEGPEFLMRRVLALVAALLVVAR
jgi:hypothetical protein